MAPDLDFLIALGQEFCWALSPPVPEDEIAPQDAHEAWLLAFGEDPSPAALAALDEAGSERLRAAWVGLFDCSEITAEAVWEAVSRTLARWPAPES